MSGLLVPARTTTLVAVLNPAAQRGVSACCHVFIITKLSLGPPTIHLHQQLVQRVLLLTLTTEVPPPPLSPHSIDLVDEEDAGGVLPRHDKEVSYLQRK